MAFLTSSLLQGSDRPAVSRFEADFQTTNLDRITAFEFRDVLVWICFLKQPCQIAITRQVSFRKHEIGGIFGIAITAIVRKREALTVKYQVQDNNRALSDVRVLVIGVDHDVTLIGLSLFRSQLQNVGFGLISFFLGLEPEVMRIGTQQLSTESIVPETTP